MNVQDTSIRRDYENLLILKNIYKEEVCILKTNIDHLQEKLQLTIIKYESQLKKENEEKNSLKAKSFNLEEQVNKQYSIIEGLYKDIHQLKEKNDRDSQIREESFEEILVAQNNLIKDLTNQLDDTKNQIQHLQMSNEDQGDQIKLQDMQKEEVLSDSDDLQSEEEISRTGNKYKQQMRQIQQMYEELLHLKDKQEEEICSLKINSKELEQELKNLCKENQELQATIAKCKMQFQSENKGKQNSEKQIKKQNLIIESLNKEIQQLKLSYKDEISKTINKMEMNYKSNARTFEEKLKTQKSLIEHLEHQLEESRSQIQKVTLSNQELTKQNSIYQIQFEKAEINTHASKQLTLEIQQKYEDLLRVKDEHEEEICSEKADSEPFTVKDEVQLIEEHKEINSFNMKDQEPEEQIKKHNLTTDDLVIKNVEHIKDQNNEENSNPIAMAHSSVALREKWKSKQT